MTEQNVYGLHQEIPEAYDFRNWQWNAEDIVTRISTAAARLVLADIKEHTRVGLYADEARGCHIEVHLSQDFGCFWISFPDLIHRWIDTHEGGDDQVHPDDATPVITALETALAKIRSLIRI